MSEGKGVPVHRMAATVSGVYLAPLGDGKPTALAYEASQPHRHDFYYCVLLEGGQLDFEIDFELVRLPTQSLLLSYPGQIHRVVAASQTRGWFLAFSPQVLDAPLRDVLDQCLAETLLLPLTGAQAATFGQGIAYLYAVRSDENQLFGPATEQALVYQVAAAYLPAERLTLGRHSLRRIDLTKAFKQLLRQRYRTMRKPAEFAAALHISTSYLNDTVRAVTGFPVTYYIQQEVMREAQRLLHQPGLTVKEIAYALGFDDAHYFSRLFSRVTGMAPGKFRQQTAAFLMSNEQ